MPSRIDLTGQRFGHATVLEDAGQRHGGTLWRVQCDCGTTWLTRGDSLRAGWTTSCNRPGCSHNPRRTHGHAICGTTSPEYSAWVSMKQRCLNPTDAYYPYYGARGITIHPEWIDSFETFFAHIGPRPSAKHSLDRIDNAGSYTPGNVRWTTHQVQMRNRRSNVLVTWQGQTHTLAGWAEILHVSHTVLQQRHHHGWSDERIVTTPVRAYTRLQAAA